jgi:hypothetical protein
VTFSKMAARLSVPKGSTKGTPRSAPANHQALGETVKSQRITIAYLAEQQAALSGQMTALTSTVADLAAIVRAVLPAAAAAAAAPLAQQAAQQQQQAKVVSPPSREESLKAQRLANLAKGRATAAANRAQKAQKAQNAPAPSPEPQVLVDGAKSEQAARRAAWKAQHGHEQKLERVVRTGKNGGVAYVGKNANAAYVVAWNRTAKAWDWSLQNGRGSKPVMGSAADRLAAFKALNAAARKAKVSEVRA